MGAIDFNDYNDFQGHIEAHPCFGRAGRYKKGSFLNHFCPKIQIFPTIPPPDRTRAAPWVKYSHRHILSAPGRPGRAKRGAVRCLYSQAEKPLRGALRGSQENRIEKPARYRPVFVFVGRWAAPWAAFRIPGGYPVGSIEKRPRWDPRGAACYMSMLAKSRISAAIPSGVFA